MVEITDKIPLTVTSDKWKETLDILEVGQSFALSAEDKQAVRHCAWKFFHKKDSGTGLPVTSKIFTVKIDSINPEGFRCWRAE